MIAMASEVAAEHLLHLFEHQRLALAVGDGADVDLFLIQETKKRLPPCCAADPGGDVAVLPGAGDLKKLTVEAADSARLRVVLSMPPAPAGSAASRCR